jgi:ribosome modulation factor
MREDDQLAHAFNAGSDSRLSGTPRHECPFHGAPSGEFGTHEGRLRSYWLMGWDHVNDHWGNQARGRYVRPLPVMVD